MKTIAVVEARPGVDRLRGILSRRLGGQGMLEWVVRRVTESQRLQACVVVAGPGVTAAEVRPHVPVEIDVWPDDTAPLVARYLAIAARYQAEALVRVGSDQPVLDPVSLDQLVAAAADGPACDYMTFSAGPDVTTPELGLFAEWIRVAALDSAGQAGEIDTTDHVSACLYRRPETFRLRLAPLPAALEQFGRQLACDDEDAWEHAQILYDCLGPDQFDWRRIAGLLGVEAQPEPAAAADNTTA